jgi:hypothetical protein
MDECTDRQMDRETDRWTDRKNGWMYRADGQTVWAYGKPDLQIRKWTDRGTHRRMGSHMG